MTLRRAPAEIIEQSDSPLVQIAEWWERCELGQVAEVTNGAAFKSALFNKNGDGMPLIRIRDVGKTETAVHYSGDYDPRYIVEPGDLVVGMDGDFRLARWTGDRALLNQRVCRLRVLDDGRYSDRFLEFVLQPYLDEIHKVTSSVTVKHLSSRTVQQLPVPLPSRSEQARVVAAIEEHFSRLDAIETGLAAAEAKCAALPSIAIAQLFSPDWSASRLDAVAQVGSGATPKRSENSYWSHGTIPWVTSGAVNHLSIRSADEFISESALAETSVKLWTAGTVLMAMYGEGKTRGKAALLEFESTCNQACAAISYDRAILDGRFLRTFLNVQYEANRRLSSGGVQPNLNLGLIKAMEVPVPALEVQKSVADRAEEVVSACTQLLDTLATARRRAVTLRRTVLAEAFTGQLVPRDPDSEPVLVRSLAAYDDNDTHSARERSDG